MCLAIPGKIIEIKNYMVIVEYPKKLGVEKKEAMNTGFNLKIGEYVFVQADIVVQKVPEKEAIDSLKTWAEVSKQ
ncbi:MAG: HypC/HybG/HupF family hydrogenase formation chaperone [Candidatus Woesearchaeota archaeon]